MFQNTSKGKRNEKLLCLKHSKDSEQNIRSILQNILCVQKKNHV